jgi:hypothetical protein
LCRQTGNLADDGLYKYTYDAWNRLVGVWYHDCHKDGYGRPDRSGERVATYTYDALFRRSSKEVANMGEGVYWAGSLTDSVTRRCGRIAEAGCPARPSRP